MSAKLVPIKSPPSDLAPILREMADLAEKGVLTDFVGMYVAADEFVPVFAASQLMSISMAAMLQDSALERFKR